MQTPLPLEHAPTAEELITGFTQGSTGNCASIAVIKAALMAFGTSSVFSQIRSEDGAHTVRMYDSGIEYTVSNSELAIAKEASKFHGQNMALLNHAIFIYGVMAKRAQLEGNDGQSNITFEQAAETLNDGEYWLDGPRWLGLSSLVVPGGDPKIPVLFRGPRKFLNRRRAGIGKSYGHTWFASMGVHDRWGKSGGPPWQLSGAIAIDETRVPGLLHSNR